jgi:Fe2+ or Zn2+ uptake regulation protein
VAASKRVALADGLQDTVSTRLRRVNQRVTANRQAIVEALSDASRPMTIPELLESRAGRGLAQSSVYRNLVVLEEAGLVHRIVTDGEFARFELAEDLTEHHHHLICTQCGLVEDFTVSEALEADLDRSLRRVASRRGFASANHRLDIVGTCANCR